MQAHFLLTAPVQDALRYGPRNYVLSKYMYPLCGESGVRRSLESFERIEIEVRGLAGMFEGGGVR